MTIAAATALITDLEAALQGSSTKEFFYQLLQRSIEFTSLTDQQIAHQFGASRPTISRWRNGRNAPHAALRPTIYNWLLGKVRAQLAENTKVQVVKVAPPIKEIPEWAFAHARKLRDLE